MITLGSNFSPNMTYNRDVGKLVQAIRIDSKLTIVIENQSVLDFDKYTLELVDLSKCDDTPQATTA
jgi:hypothetical protein